MSWKALPLIAIAGVAVLLLAIIQMRKNNQDVFFNSVGYALEQLHRDLSETNASPEMTSFKIEEWRPYLQATPAGRLPGFVSPSDIFIASSLQQGHTNIPRYLVAVRINDAIACGLKANGKCARMTADELDAWPHTILSP